MCAVLLITVWNVNNVLTFLCTPNTFRGCCHLISSFTLWTKHLIFGEKISYLANNTTACILVTAISICFLYSLHSCQFKERYCHTWDWMPCRFSLWVVQNWSSTVGPGWFPWSSNVPESFFRTFHICPDQCTIRVSIEYNKPWSSSHPDGLREKASV